MVTTIQVSSKLLLELKQRKMYPDESYENLLWDLLEDNLELSEETKKNILLAEKQFKEGKFYTHEQVKKRLGF